MNEQRASAQNAWGRVSFPVFVDENTPKQASEMNAFYETLRDAVLAYAEELNAERREGLRMLAAEYTAATVGQQITVTYIVTVRHRGRVIGRKRLTHTWEDGVLIPPRKKKKPLFGKRRSAGKG